MVTFGGYRFKKFTKNSVMILTSSDKSNMKTQNNFSSQDYFKNSLKFIIINKRDNSIN